MYSLRPRSDPRPSTLQAARASPRRTRSATSTARSSFTTLVRDDDSGLLAARQLVDRFDPEKPIVWYFAEGFPEYKPFFTGPNGIKDQTNQLMKDAGVAARVDFQELERRATCQDGQPPSPVRRRSLQLPPLGLRPRHAELLGRRDAVRRRPAHRRDALSSISFNDFAIKDYYVQRIDAYLQMVGAQPTDVQLSAGEWPATSAACKDGDDDADRPRHRGRQPQRQLVALPEDAAVPAEAVDTFGNLGPQDFIQPQDADFFSAFYALAPYYVFADPDMNPFVIREGGAGVLGPGDIWADAPEGGAVPAARGADRSGATPPTRTSTGSDRSQQRDRLPQQLP